MSKCQQIVGIFWQEFSLFYYHSNVFPHICWVDNVWHVNTMLNMTWDISMGKKSYKIKIMIVWITPYNIKIRSLLGTLQESANSTFIREWPISTVGFYFDILSWYPPNWHLRSVHIQQKARNFSFLCAHCGKQLVKFDCHATLPWGMRTLSRDYLLLWICISHQNEKTSVHKSTDIMEKRKLTFIKIIGY